MNINQRTLFIILLLTSLVQAEEVCLFYTSKKHIERSDSINNRPFFKFAASPFAPSKLNGLATLEEVAQLLAEYDVIVLGNELQSPDNPDYQDTVTIIHRIHELSPSSLIFGYIDLGVNVFNVSIPVMKVFAQQWKTAGADGIFWDDAGYYSQLPFVAGTTRERQTAMILYARSLGMINLLNVGDGSADDIFSSAVHPLGNPTGAPSAMGPNDWFQIESLPINTFAYENNDGFLDRATLLARIRNAQFWRSQVGSKIVAQSYVEYDANTDDKNQYYRSINQALGFIFSLDAYGDTDSSPENNRIYNGLWNMEMAAFSKNGPQEFHEDTPTTLNRYDYPTTVYYEDHGRHAIVAPVLAVTGELE